MSFIIGNCAGPNAYLQLSDAIVAAVTGTSVKTVGVGAGGTGYTVGDILTLSTGTATVPAQVEVTAVSGGVVTGVRLYNAGVYSVAPSSPGATTGGTGSGATVTVTTGTNGWTAQRDTTYSGSEREVILEGSGGGGDSIFVGWRTFSDSGNGVYNFELHGFTGFDSGIAAGDIDEQPGVSPGFFDNVADRGCYLLSINTSLDYWISVTGYRIIIITKVGTSYFNAYLGWGNRYATESEYPYPLIVAGHTNNPDASYSQSALSSGLTDPWSYTVSSAEINGPMMILFTDGVWYNVQNAYGTTTPTARSVHVVLPVGRTTAVTDASTPEEDKFMGTLGNFSEFLPLSGTPTARLYQTPGTANGIALLPTTIMFWTPGPQIVAELDDVYVVSAVGGVLSEDRIDLTTEVYRVFQNCNRSDLFAFLAIKEE